MHGWIMRIFFTSDFHGRRTLYRQLGEALRRERPDLLILGGDMLPDCTGASPPARQAAWVKDMLGPMIETYLEDAPGLTTAICMGNHDWLASESAIRDEERAGRMRLLDPGRIWSYGGFNFLGFYYSPPSPHYAKDYERLDMETSDLPQFDCETLVSEGGGVRQATVEEHFGRRPSIDAELSSVVVPERPWIFLSHAPPHETNLDRLPNLTLPIGSQAVRRFVETHRPECGLFGHVHESPEVSGSCLDELNGTPCINPGQSRARLQGVIFDTDDLRQTLRHTVFA